MMLQKIFDLYRRGEEALDYIEEGLMLLLPVEHLDRQDLTRRIEALEHIAETLKKILSEGGC